MEVVVLIARILFALLFIGSGVGHNLDVASTAAKLRSRGLEPAETLARVSGLTLLIGGWCVVLGVFMDVVLIGLAVQVLIMGFMIHPFWKMKDDPAVWEVEMAHFMKNLCIAGACIQLMAFSAWQPFTITGPLLFGG